MKRSSVLPSDRPFASAGVSRIDGTPYALSKHVWSSRSGSSARLAPGSIVANSYREYQRTVTGTMNVFWDGFFPASRFPSSSATISISDSGSMDIGFSDEIWVEGTKEVSGTTTNFFVSNAVLESDVDDLKSGGLLKTEKDLELIVIDSSGVSEIVNTVWDIKIEAEDRFRRGRLKKVFDGVVPQNLISSERGRRFVLELGQLDLDTKKLKRNTEVRVTVKARRSFGGKSKTVEFIINRSLR